MRWRISLVASLALFVAVSCDQQPVEPQTQEAATPLFNGVHGNEVVHQVSVGGPDSCYLRPGCDGNFSLTAAMRADGTVTGEWTDVLGGFDPVQPVHITIDCLAVDGNQAWVSGYVTVPKWAYGLPAVTEVVDNGTSVTDPADQIGWTHFVPILCTDMVDFPLYDVAWGQVKVR